MPMVEKQGQAPTPDCRGRGILIRSKKMVGGRHENGFLASVGVGPRLAMIGGGAQELCRWFGGVVLG